MKLNLYTTTYNNEAIMLDFINFYKGKVPDINITIFDMASTDKTVELAKENKCIVKNFKDFYTNKDQFRNDCWKYIPCDAVVLCNINEFIDITPDLFSNCTLIQSKGYDVATTKDLQISEETRNINYDKFCIFDKSTFKEMNFEGQQCNPMGFVQIGEKKPIMYHILKLK